MYTRCREIDRLLMEGGSGWVVPLSTSGDDCLIRTLANFTVLEVPPSSGSSREEAGLCPHKRRQEDPVKPPKPLLVGGLYDFSISSNTCSRVSHESRGPSGTTP
ncbi:hypothetical protein B296_00038613 [Ensete ventricosum]|uniref:Uncharacterized protein n=1 Tax=Ensete ventricosum TaxID=4639 RepID=A0A426YBN5_ENSVE|nr:hypothetical protein B296_00038613 [Ensete ventricosum]